MTFDDLDREVNSVKKKGLSPFVQENLIKQVRKQFYEEKIAKDLKAIVSLIHKNTLFLERQIKASASSHNIKDYLGVSLAYNYQDWYLGKETSFRLEFALIIANYFAVPVELLMFTDLEANERTIKEQYPLIFKQSRN